MSKALVRYRRLVFEGQVADAAVSTERGKSVLPSLIVQVAKQQCGYPQHADDESCGLLRLSVSLPRLFACPRELVRGRTKHVTE